MWQSVSNAVTPAFPDCCTILQGRCPPVPIMYTVHLMRMLGVATSQLTITTGTSSKAQLQARQHVSEWLVRNGSFQH